MCLYFSKDKGLFDGRDCVLFIIRSLVLVFCLAHNNHSKHVESLFMCSILSPLKAETMFVVYLCITHGTSHRILYLVDVQYKKIELHR